MTGLITPKVIEKSTARNVWERHKAHSRTLLENNTCEVGEV